MPGSSFPQMSAHSHIGRRPGGAMVFHFSYGIQNLKSAWEKHISLRVHQSYIARSGCPGSLCHQPGAVSESSFQLTCTLSWRVGIALQSRSSENHHIQSLTQALSLCTMTSSSRFRSLSLSAYAWETERSCDLPGRYLLPLFQAGSRGTTGLWTGFQ